MLLNKWLCEITEDATPADVAEFDLISNELQLLGKKLDEISPSAPRDLTAFLGEIPTQNKL